MSDAASRTAGLYTVAFLLAPGLAELHIDIALEALRIANRVSAHTAFRALLCTVDDGPVLANNGRVLRPDCALGALETPAALFIVAGLEPELAWRPALAPHLRALDRRRCLLGAIDTGAVFLAEADLLRGVQAAIHWEYEPVFRFRYPGIATSGRGFVWAGRRLTCSGGLSVADMMVELVRRLAGHRLSQRLADVLNYERSLRSGSIAPTPGARNRVERAAALMRENLEAPLRLGELASALRVNAKTLARAFVREHGQAPMAYYRRLRLEHGRELLRLGRVSVKQAAYASGFSSPAHFSSAFRAAYGHPPGKSKPP